MLTSRTCRTITQFNGRLLFIDRITWVAYNETAAVTNGRRTQFGGTPDGTGRQADR